MKLKKHLLWIVPLLIIVIFAGLFYFKQLNDLVQSPVQGWSRSVPLPITDIEEPPFVYKEGNEYIIYGNSGDQVKKLVINRALKVSEEKTFPIKVSPETNVWGNQNTLIYQTKKGLVKWEDGKASLITDKIEDLAFDQNGVYYFNGKKLFFTDGEMASNLHTFDAPIAAVVTSRTSDHIIIRLQKGSQFPLLYMDSKDPARIYPLTVISKSTNESISNLSFIEQDHKLQVIYSITGYVQGINKDYYQYTFNIDELKISSAPKNVNKTSLSFINKETGLPIIELMNLEFSVLQGTPTILFSAEGPLRYRLDSLNIYTAKKKGDKWIATRRNTNKVSKEAFFFDDHVLGWLGYTNPSEMQLYASSDSPEAIKKSLEVTAEDHQTTLNNSLIRLSIDFLVWFFGMMFALPVLFLLLICYMANTTAFERKSPFIKWTVVVGYVISWYVFLNYFIADKLLVHLLPAYLDIPYSIYLYGGVLLLLAYGITHWLKHEDWGLSTELFYFIMINTLFFSFLFGHYTYY